MLGNLPKISVIGLGKLGSPMAAVFANSGLQVIGVDNSTQVVAAINSGSAPIDEPLLQSYIDQAKGKLTATTDYQHAILNSDVSFVILPTPSMNNDQFSNDYLLTAVKAIGQSLKEKTGYHLVVITSTTMPGSTDGIIKDTLEKHSGRVVGERLGLCYNPEFIALGSVIRDMINPDFILIGESDQRAGDLLASIHQHYCSSPPSFRRMSGVNAELAKIAINTFVTTKISYANMLAEMCENLPGADVNTVTQAVGNDSRIGAKYLKGALGYGGPCFPRDNKAFCSLGEELGVRCDLASATDAINNHQITRLTRIIAQNADDTAHIAVLGLSYKPDTAVIDASQGIEFVEQLYKQGYTITAFDPMANELARATLTDKAIIADSIAQAIASADIVAILTPWQQFHGIEKNLIDHLQVNCVVDPWRVLNREHVNDSINLIQMGRADELVTSKDHELLLAAK